MPAITIRDVPAETRDELAARAARSGRSLQEYVRMRLIELADRSDPEVSMDQIRAPKQHTASTMPAAQILAHRDAERC